MLRENVGKNFEGRTDCVVPEIAHLDWLRPGTLPTKEFDIILVSDCIYEQLYGESWKALAQVLKELATPSTLVLNAVERRKDDGISKFNTLMESLGFVCTLLSKHTSDEREELELYELSLQV